MSLNKETIKAGIAQAFTDVMNQEQGRENAVDRIADQIADAVVAAIKSAKINYTAGLTSPQGAVTGTFNHTIE